MKIRLIVSIVLAVLLIFGSEIARAQEATSPQAPAASAEKVDAKKPAETLEQRVARLEALKKKELENETAEETEVRLRAQKIELEKKLENLKSDKKKKDSAEMKEARKQIENEAKRVAKREKRFATTLQLANVTGCPLVKVMQDYVEHTPEVGQPYQVSDLATEPAMVEVDYRVEEFSYSNPVLSLIVFNDSTVPIDILTSFKRLGPIVRNLCPGGTINLSIPLRWEDQNFMDVNLTALGRPPKESSEVGTLTQDMLYTLSKYNYDNAVQNRTWHVQLYRVYQTR